MQIRISSSFYRLLTDNPYLLSVRGGQDSWETSISITGFAAKLEYFWCEKFDGAGNFQRNQAEFGGGERIRTAASKPKA